MGRVKISRRFVAATYLRLGGFNTAGLTTSFELSQATILSTPLLLMANTYLLYFPALTSYGMTTFENPSTGHLLPAPLLAMNIGWKPRSRNSSKK